MLLYDVGVVLDISFKCLRPRIHGLWLVTLVFEEAFRLHLDQLSYFQEEHFLAVCRA